MANVSITKDNYNIYEELYYIKKGFIYFDNKKQIVVSNLITGLCTIAICCIIPASLGFFIKGIIRNELLGSIIGYSVIAFGEIGMMITSLVINYKIDSRNSLKKFQKNIQILILI